MPKPAYGRQGLDWIVGPGYSFGVFSMSRFAPPKNVTSRTGGSNWPFRCLDVQCVSFAWHVIFLGEDFDETQIRLQYRNASHISASSTVTGLSSLSLLSLLVIVIVLLLWLQYCNASHISASSAATGLLALPSTVEATTFFDDLKQTDR